MIEFYKYHGLGNDFILIDNRKKTLSPTEDRIRALCSRNFGIGGDGVILVEESDKAHVKMDIYNADGSHPNMCGNGIRCFAQFVYERGIQKTPVISVETGAGILEARLSIEEGKAKGVKINMGRPIFSYRDIPCTIEKEPIVNEKIKIGDNTFEITTLLMGVPHTIVFTEDIQADTVRRWGSLIEKSSYFPQGTNVNLVKVISRKEIALRTWERGAGATLACGTGACAGVVAGILGGILDESAVVHLAGGDLQITWADRQAVYMEGPAEEVFYGRCNI